MTEKAVLVRSKFDYLNYFHSFMDRLQQQLKYFVSSKISTDTLWQDCKVILSGHETPGEGEHKIMDYIRYERSKPDYDSNTRHCLYGLDAGEPAYDSPKRVERTSSIC